MTQTQFIYRERKNRSGHYIEARRYADDRKPEWTTCCFEQVEDARKAAAIEAEYRNNNIPCRFVDGWPVVSHPIECPACGSEATHKTGGFSGDIRVSGGYMGVDIDNFECLSCGVSFSD